MTQIRTTTAGRWFMRVLWLGILVNLALAIATLAIPGTMLELNRLPAAEPLLWTRFSGLLLILLSIFYMPAGIDPDRYRANAWMAVASRLVGVIFFLLFQLPVYRNLGLIDLVFFIPEVILLTVAVKSAKAAPAIGAMKAL
jgi:hypothetical protein